MSPGYKLLRQFNAAPPTCASSRRTIDERSISHFPSAGLADRLARALARERAVPLKELFESFEFFERVRKRVRARVVADVCAGHGLTGVLFALFERHVERVVLLDRHKPKSFERVLRAAAEIGPWVAEKVFYLQAPLSEAPELLGEGTSIVAVHACGTRTDRAIDLAVRLGGALAVMPCCYPDARCPAPAAVVSRLGTALAFDVDRTYRLERAGYRVRWDDIPAEITPMARLLVAWPTGAGSTDGTMPTGAKEAASLRPSRGDRSGVPANRRASRAE